MNRLTKRRWWSYLIDLDFVLSPRESFLDEMNLSPSHPKPFAVCFRKPRPLTMARSFTLSGCLQAKAGWWQAGGRATAQESGRVIRAGWERKQPTSRWTAGRGTHEPLPLAMKHFLKSKTHLILI